jgi:hypothetical protein
VDEKGQLVVVPHGFKTAKRGERLSYRFPNDLVRLRNGESKQIKVDLAQFPWNDRILSGWPAGDHFNYVPKGAYLLEFKISTDRDDVASNQETVSLD